MLLSLLFLLPLLGSQAEHCPSYGSIWAPAFTVQLKVSISWLESSHCKFVSNSTYWRLLRSLLEVLDSNLGKQSGCQWWQTENMTMQRWLQSVAFRREIFICLSFSCSLLSLWTGDSRMFRPRSPHLGSTPEPHQIRVGIAFSNLYWSRVKVWQAQILDLPMRTCSEWLWICHVR